MLQLKFNRLFNRLLTFELFLRVFQENRFFSRTFKNLSIKNNLFQLHWKRGNFWEKKSSHQKTLNICLERVNEYLRRRKNYGRYRGSNPSPPVSEPRWHPTHVLYKTPTTLQTCKLCSSWAISGQRQKTTATELNIFLSKKIFQWIINFILICFFFGEQWFFNEGDEGGRE